MQAWTGPEGSRKLRLPDFVTTAQDGGRLSALSTGRFYHRILKCILLVIYVFWDLINAWKVEYIKISRNIFGPKTFSVSDSRCF